MIQFKRTAFIVFTSLTPFTSAFAKSNTRKCHKSLKAVASPGGANSGDKGLGIEAIVIGSTETDGKRSGHEISGPVVLYNDGTACLDISLLSTDDDIQTIKAEHPEDFVSWNYNSNHEIELRSALGGLGGLTMTARVEPLPQGFRLEHNYTSLTNKAAAYSNDDLSGGSYRFLEDGTFFSGNSVAAANFKDASTNPSEHGYYLIDGYMIQLVFDDGHVESHSIVADSTDNSVIWLDGETFIDQE